MTVQSEGVQTHSPSSGSAGGPKAPVLKRQRSGSGAGRLSKATPYLLLLPATLATLVLLGYPAVKIVLISFQKLNMFELIQHTTVWNGFQNYTDQLTSGEFWHTAERSVFFTLANVVLIMVVGSLVGLLLNRLGKRMRLFLSVALILAWAMPVVAATTVYQWLFDSQFGVADWFLSAFGWHSMAHYNWFSTQLSTFAVITLLIVWMSIPFVALTMYAALTTIPGELYEAARMDGAGMWKSFRFVTFPALKPFFLGTTFLEVIWIFKAFTQVLAVNQGGPDRLTETLPVYSFVEGVGNQHYGVGAAIAVLTILILLALTAYYLRIILKQEDEL
ncbi:carbohydrate ABC transporter permease [Streptacidiphilus jiangxiensis]|uniref:N,N'-diacetylchitobiose transport system permease protein n=1 Tax=Streptacidiphilus jiangxiensis TaxID=235985 RepID=A0A1H7G533_STRJI|nr:sugar ABC transporter permease [Streptacidiphilus jiangxiensis]SEK31570.1 N,N'-diacetylchitobiose transport system permease protein [Streptacidiphilus jiangxiensis]